jgi:flagellar motor switch/type III secretory pathway protein FliN
MNPAEVLERFGDLRFDVELEVGSLQLTLGEMFDLKEGMVLKTGHPAGQPFALHAGGAELGTAEIVVLGSACSLKVKSLAQKPTKSADNHGTH